MRNARFPLVGLLLLPAFPALAQNAAAAQSSGGMTWLWVLIAILVVAGGIWYFMTQRRGLRSTPGVSHDRVGGAAERAKGAVKDTFGSVTGDTKLQAEGKIDKAEGRTQSAYGGVKDTLRGR
jgi:uncharacterized protein YjbJ (UPF0337 family)